LTGADLPSIVADPRTVQQIDCADLPGRRPE